MLKAVIFDMDGVIIDSEPLHAKAAVLAMKKYNVNIDEDYCYNFVGSTDKYMLEVIKERFDLAASIEELMAANDEAKRTLLSTSDYPIIPYVKELMEELHTNGIKLAIASSSPKQAIENTIKNLKLTEYITVYVSGLEVENPKPAPDIFLKTAEKLGIEPSECVVIEDSYNGVTAAAAAKMTRIGFLNPNSGIQDLSRVNFVIEGFDEINTKFITQVYQRSKGQPVTIATTERLIIRELSVNDIPDVYKIYQTPEVRQYVDDIDDYLNVEISKHKAYIKNVYSFYGYGYWGVFSKEDNNLIGRCGIQNNEIDGKTEIELSYLLGVNHWGFGYAIECVTSVLDYGFNELHIPRIVAVIDKINYRSRKVAENVGMKIEKSIRHRHRDCYLYVIEKK